MNTVLARFFFAVSMLFTAATAIADGVDEPIPSFYQEAGLPSTRSTEAQHPVERIDPFTGKLQWHAVDLYIPGNGGMDIKVQRSYSSMNEMLADESPYGVGWTLHFGRVLRKLSVNVCAVGQNPSLNAVLELPDGSRQIMYDSMDVQYQITTGLWKGTCATGPEGGIIVQSPDGTRYEMTTAGPSIGSDATHRQSAWYTTRMVDRNGNWLAFTYEAQGGAAFGVKTITSSDGRSVNFTYSGGVLSTVSGAGASWSYAFEHVTGVTSNHYNLTHVSRPDGTSWAYEYNAPGAGPGIGTAGGYSMKKVTYPTGGTIDYTYGFATMSPNQAVPASTVITQKQTVEGVWTYAYQPATTQVGSTYVIDPAGGAEFDKATFTGPDGSTIYYHFGYNSVATGKVYLIGSLAGKVINSVISGASVVSQIESYSWLPGQISSQPNGRPGTGTASDTITAAPLLAEKDVSRNGQIYRTAMSNFDVVFNPQTIVETGTDTRTTTLTYYTDPVKWILHQKKDETVDTIGTITRTFDANGNLANENRYGVSTGFTYTGQGDLATKQDARGNTSTYSGYAGGVPQSESHPEGVTITRQVDAMGNIRSQTDGTNVTTTYGYDLLNRLTSITHPAGNQVTVTWSPNSRTVTRGAYREVVAFDGFGRQTQVVHTDSGTGQTVQQTYRNDSLGRRIYASYPNDSKGTAFIYDLVGQTWGIYHGYDPVSQSHSSTRVFQFGSSTVDMTNERGYKYTYTYRGYGDPDHRDLLKIDAPDPTASVTMQRNGLGQLTQAVQDGKTRSYTYDTRFYLATMSDPEVGTTTYGRDAVGNMISRQVGSSPTTQFTYDGRNRLSAVTYPAGTPSVTRTYYADDKPKSSDNGVARHDYVYDGNKNLTKETLTIVGQPAFEINYAYNGNDALDVLTYVSGKRVTYAPDAFGRPTKAAPYVRSVTHHPNGQVATIAYANGVTSTIGLNARQWPQTQSISGPSLLANQSYTYDEAGNVFGISDTVDTAYNRTMDYDPVDRLTRADGSWGPGSITYNGQGDIKSQSLGSAFGLTYTYDASNRLASVSGSRNLTYSYDVYGNVIGNGTKVFAYNDASNMRCANCGAGETTYDYDAGNMRVRSTRGGVATFYIYSSNGSLLTEQSSSSSTEYIYLHGKQVAMWR